MNLRFITSDCNCKYIDKIDHWHSESWFNPKYDTDTIQAFLHFKYELERKTIWFAVHIKNQHINNIFVNGQSIRRIG